MTFGTRPEAIKLAPLHKEFQRRADRIRLVCCVTGQHRELLDSVLQIFDIHPDHDLNILKASQDLFHVTTGVLEGMKAIFVREQPDLVIVQGDTTTAFAAALGAFYLQIPIAHVEAGLRSYDRFQPFPEEINRAFISRIADLNFCPTTGAAKNLIQEQIARSSIFVTGNTGIDALLTTVKLMEEGRVSNPYPADLNLPAGRMILVTGHRRENFGEGLANLAWALADLVKRYDDVTVVYSEHPNPNVRKAIQSILSGNDRIRIIQPPDYFRFVTLMRECFFLITDSGGIQEEAPSLKKPVLVARWVTERPEAIEAGTARLVGNDREKIVAEASRLLDDPKHYASMVASENPFGDGRSCVRIADAVEGFFRRRAAGKGSRT